MKKSIKPLLTLAMGVLLVGCSDYMDDSLSSYANNQNGYIAFSRVSIEGNAHATRGYATTAANALSQITSFQTWGYDATTNNLYMGESATTGRIVSNTGDARNPAWSYSPQQFWPVNNLSFVAIAPADYSAVSDNTTSSADGVVSVASTVTIPVDVEKQKDLMYAEGDKVNKTTDGGNIPFTFKHALSQIVFKGKFNGDGAVTKVIIKDITLMNIKDAGTVNFTSEGNFPTITSLTGAANYQLDAEDLEGATWEATTQGTTAFDLTISENADKNNAWFLLPQQLDGSGTLVKAGETAPTDGKTYLRVAAQLEKNGVVILEDTNPIYIPVGTNWERSKKYVYTIEFNGSAALTPITFSVEAEGWTDVNAPYEWKDITATVNAAQDMSSYLSVAGNFSGITAIDDNHFAIVDDKSSNEGWYPVTITFNEDGTISSLSQNAFVIASSGLSNQDNEAITYNPVINTMFLTREMGNQIMEYSTEGNPTGRYISTSSFSGVTSNAGFEALTYNKNLRKFYTTTERSTSADAAGTVKIVQYDGENLQANENWVYMLEDALYSPVAGDTYAKGVSDLCTLEDGRLLVLEREALVSPSTVSAKTITKIFIVNPAKTSQGTTLEKTLLTSCTTTDNMLSVLSKGYFDFANYEGMCLGPRMADGSRLLILITDSQNRYSVGSYSLKDFWRTIRLYGI